ncbi:MAG: hypothetical protein AABX07_03685 [Nanoarchaeota archaeon]
MVNKRGWLRLIEVTIAIFIVLSFLIINPNKKEKTIEVELSEIIAPILDQIAANSITREEVLQRYGDSIVFNKVNQQISPHLKAQGINYELKLCALDEPCDASPPTKIKVKEKNMETFERVISSTPDYFSPKRIKIFAWRQ